MDFRPLLELFEGRLKDLNRSADDVSNAAGHRDGIRNLQRKARGEIKGGVTVDVVFDIAKELKIAPEALCRVLMGHPALTDEETAAKHAALLDVRSMLDAQIEAIAPERAPKRRKRRA